MNDEEIIKTFKGNLVDYISKLKETADKVNQLQSNWNSLREYVEKRIQDCKRYYPCCSEEFQHLLDKMNELEGKDKE